MIDAESARAVAEKYNLNYDTTIDPKLFVRIKELSSGVGGKGHFNMDLNRPPTKAEHKKLIELGYRYDYDYSEYGESHTISWDVPKPSLFERVFKRMFKRR